MDFYGAPLLVCGSEIQAIACHKHHKIEPHYLRPPFATHALSNRPDLLGNPAHALRQHATIGSPYHS